MLDNKYKKLYFKIVDNAKSKNRKKNPNGEYFEKHHIIPSCIDPNLRNLKNNPSNGVIVTTREHFLLHYLLCKMYKKDTNEWHKVNRAFTFMYAFNNHKGRYMNSRLYELGRKNIGYIMSQSQSGSGNSQFGKVWISDPMTKCDPIKIPKDELDDYIELGWVPGRILQWNLWERRHEIAAEKRLGNARRANYRKLDTVNRKLAEIEQTKADLLAEQERLNSPGAYIGLE